MTVDALADHIVALGGSKASEGSFLLEPGVVLEKLIQEALPSAGLWTVKLVQAAVAAGADEVKFTFNKMSIDFSIKGGHLPSSAELFHWSTSNQGHPPDSALHLMAAIRSLYRLSPRALTWSSHSQGVPDRIDIAGNKVTYGQRSSSMGDSSFRLSVKFQLRRLLLLKRMASDYKAVCDRSRLCPIPVIVDSRLVSRREPPLPVLKPVSAVWVTEERKDSPHFALHLGQVTEPANKDGIYIGAEESWITRRTLPEAGVYNCPLVVCLTKSTGEYGSGTVHWLVDGALVEQTALPCAVEKWEIDLVCPASLEDLEATGWSPKSPERLLPKKLIAETLQSLHDALEPYPQALESAVLSHSSEGAWAKMDKVLFSCMFTLAAEGWKAGTQAHWSGKELLASLQRVCEGLTSLR